MMLSGVEACDSLSGEAVLAPPPSGGCRASATRRRLTRPRAQRAAKQDARVTPLQVAVTASTMRRLWRLLRCCDAGGEHGGPQLTDATSADGAAGRLVKRIEGVSQHARQRPVDHSTQRRRGESGSRTRKRRLRSGEARRAARPEAGHWLNSRYHVRSHRGEACTPMSIGTELPDTMKRTTRAMAMYSLRFNASREILSVERSYTHIPRQLHKVSYVCVMTTYQHTLEPH